MSDEKCAECGCRGERVDENCAGCKTALCGNCYRKWFGFCTACHEK